MKEMPMPVQVRPATPHDLDGIMCVEVEQFGEIDAEAMAPRGVMDRRIVVCNSGTIPWFYVATLGDEVVAYMVLQPTRISPEECVSFAMATDNGTLKATFDQSGGYIYGVSLGASRRAPEGTTDLLIHQLGLVWLQTNKRKFMICSRMPGYAEARAQTGVPPEAYWQQTGEDGLPADWLLRHFQQMIGVRPARFLENGWPVDAKSDGHGVLCVGEDPARLLAESAHRIYRAGMFAAQPSDAIEPGPKVLDLYGGSRRWYDVATGTWVTAVTAYMAQGCPDWGETDGIRNDRCVFCGLPGLATAYRDAYFDGVMTHADHLAMFQAVAAHALASEPSATTFMVFNAGSFLASKANSPVTQLAVIRELCAQPRIKRIVIESRAPLITRKALEPLVALTQATGKHLTIRIGVETRNKDMRLQTLKKGQTEEALRRAMDAMNELGVSAGAYVLLGPLPGIGPMDAVRETVDTIRWVLAEPPDGLGMLECYFCSTCVAEYSPFQRLWEQGSFNPPSLWAVLKVLCELPDELLSRVHLLPMLEPGFVAVSSAHVRRGIGQDLTGAEGCDAAFHGMLNIYRETRDKAVLVPPDPDCICKPDWF